MVLLHLPLFQVPRAPGLITVKVPRERKLRKFAGGRDDGMLEEWIGGATRAIAGQTDADAVDFLL